MVKGQRAGDAIEARQREQDSIRQQLRKQHRFGDIERFMRGKMLAGAILQAERENGNDRKRRRKGTVSSDHTPVLIRDSKSTADVQCNRGRCESPGNVQYGRVYFSFTTTRRGNVHYRPTPNGYRLRNPN